MVIETVRKEKNEWLKGYMHHEVEDVKCRGSEDVDKKWKSL